MNNNREVCFAVDAGFTEFTNLPGLIKTGCPNTPAYKSRYCASHGPLVAIPHKLDEAKEVVTVQKAEEPRLAGIITGKRTTRSSMLFEVHAKYMIYSRVNQCLVYTQVAWLGIPVLEST